MPQSPSELLDRFYASLPEAEKRALELARDSGQEQGAALYLVGGPVRDVLLSRPSVDIDVAVEGDVPELARALSARTGQRVVEHGRFGTATLRGAGFTIDFARTRSETYSRPGALPDVEPAGIDKDLARRDFTVNAMALRLTEPAGELLDPFGGRTDLDRGRLRVLHGRSFEDDATRILRAARYAARLGFEIEQWTLGLIERDLPFLDAISGSRLRAEMTRAFKEASAPDAESLMERMGALKRIHPLLRLGEEGRMRRTTDILAVWGKALAGTHHAPAEELGYCLVSSAQTEDEASSLSERLHLTGRVERALQDLVRLRGLSDKLRQPDMRPSQAVETLERFAPSAIWALGLKSGDAIEERCTAYLEGWRRVRPALNGFDLERLGIRGPEAGRALRRLREARLDGETRTRKDEEALAIREFGKAGR